MSSSESAALIHNSQQNTCENENAGHGFRVAGNVAMAAGILVIADRAREKAAQRQLLGFGEIAICERPSLGLEREIHKINADDSSGCTARFPN